MPVAGRLSGGGGGSSITLPCEVDVEENTFVYLNTTDAKLGLALASDPSKMPAIGYVTSVRRGKATITKMHVLEDAIGIAPNYTYFISETHQGRIQTTPPITGSVSQVVAKGIAEGMAVIDVHFGDAVYR